MEHWIAARQLDRLTASSAASSWLTERGSLTARLRRQHPELAVRVWSEGLRRLLPHEARRLDLAPDSLAWVREVTLHEDGLELVEARTAIPCWSPDNPWRLLRQLGARPLGEILFSEPDLERSDFDFTLGPGWRGSDTPSDRLARRCVFRRQGAALLLTERFLRVEV